MPSKQSWLLCVAISWNALLFGQSGMHNLDEEGGKRNLQRQRAFLTVNQTDEWIFDGEENETIVAHVTTKEFDPVLGIAKKIEKQDDLVLVSVDDEGSESRFIFRLKEKGRFAIRVHAFKNQGGGNYELSVRRFMAKPIKVGDTVTETLDKAGEVHYYFDAKKGQIIVPTVINNPEMEIGITNLKGTPSNDWLESKLIEEDGEYGLVFSASAGRKYEVSLRAATHHTLELGKEIAGDLRPGDMEVWSFPGKPGDMRLLEIEGGARLRSNLSDARPLKKNEHELDPLGESRRKDMETLPVAARGNRLRYAVILGRDSEYQFQMLASEPTSYKMKFVDPRVPIEFGNALTGGISVGGAAFYRFEATAGQLFHVKLASKQFVPVLRLCDPQGETLAIGDLFEKELSGQVTHLAKTGGTYLVQISSLGDGGGGDFQLELSETKLKELKIDGRYQSSLVRGQTEYWTFDGKQGEAFFLHARSKHFSPSVTVRDPDGHEEWARGVDSQGTGSLIAIKVTKSGRYTIGISSGSDGGEYILRVLEAE